MGTTTHGYRYPDATDLVKDGATAIQRLANDVESRVGRVAAASGSASPAAGSSATVVIPFGATFPSAPTVVATVVGGAGAAQLIRAAVTAVTTTQCTVTLWRDSGSTSAITVNVIAAG